MLIKTDDGVVINTKEAEGDGGVIMHTNGNHFTIVYWFEADGAPCMKAVATYSSEYCAFNALRKLERTGELSADGKITLEKENEIIRQFTMNLFYKYNQPLYNAQMLVEESDEI